MNGHLHSLITFAFFIFYVYFRKESLRKLRRNLRNESDLFKFERQFTTLSIICIVASFIVLTFRDLNRYFVPFESLENVLVNSVGMLLIKLSFIWLIVTGLHISDVLDLIDDKPSTAAGVRKIEFAMTIAVVLLSIGTLFSTPSIATLIVSSISIGTFFISLKIKSA